MRSLAMMTSSRRLVKHIVMSVPVMALLVSSLIAQIGGTPIQPTQALHQDCTARTVHAERGAAGCVISSTLHHRIFCLKGKMVGALRKQSYSQMPTIPCHFDVPILQYLLAETENLGNFSAVAANFSINLDNFQDTRCQVEQTVHDLKCELSSLVNKCPVLEGINIPRHYDGQMMFDDFKQTYASENNVPFAFWWYWEGITKCMVRQSQKIMGNTVETERADCTLNVCID